MANPTTVRLSPEREERVEKMAALYGTQSGVINRALDYLWSKVGEQAEGVWSAIQIALESQEVREDSQ